MTEKKFLIFTGLIIGAISVALTVYGNPANMGFCIACFIRDTAGSLKLHSAPVVQYMRPEIIGLVLGAALSALIRREFTPKGGSSSGRRRPERFDRRYRFYRRNRRGRVLLKTRLFA